MALSIFPAAPGTFLVERERNNKTYMTPVVGFAHVQGSVVMPLCAISHGGLTLGRALQTPDGRVTDPAYGAVFTDQLEWEAMVDTEHYWSTKSKVAAPMPAEAPAEAVEKRGPGRPPAEGPKRQLFQTTSFWSIPSHNLVFAVPGGQPAPGKKDDRYGKITREAMVGLKKSGATELEYERGIVFFDEQPEDPADAGARVADAAHEPEDDEDDIEDLV